MTDRRHTHLYNNRRWRRLREQQLQMFPFCEFCGPPTVATVCDHVEPHRGNVERFWAGPFQSLCGPCHNSDKQRMENGKDPRPRFGEDGLPLGEDND